MGIALRVMTKRHVQTLLYYYVEKSVIGFIAAIGLLVFGASEHIFFFQESAARLTPISCCMNLI